MVRARRVQTTALSDNWCDTPRDAVKQRTNAAARVEGAKHMVDVALLGSTLALQTGPLACFAVSPAAVLPCCCCSASVHVLSSLMLGGTTYARCNHCAAPRCLKCVQLCKEVEARREHSKRTGLPIGRLPPNAVRAQCCERCKHTFVNSAVRYAHSPGVDMPPPAAKTR